MYDAVLTLGSACLTGLAVKLMDDRLDEPLDSLTGRRNLTTLLGRADTAYALLSLTLAVALSPAVALVLFAASYSVGMAHEPGRLSPLGLPYWGESVAVLAVGALAVGVRVQAAALLGVGAVQLVDDIRDRWQDPYQKPVTGRLGGVGCGILAALATALGIALEPLLVLSTFAAYALYEFVATRRG